MKKRYSEILNELMNDHIVMDVVKRRATDEMTFCLRAYGAVGSLFDAVDAMDAIEQLKGK
jgi:hypothetical protein